MLDKMTMCYCQGLNLVAEFERRRIPYSLEWVWNPSFWLDRANRLTWPSTGYYTVKLYCWTNSRLFVSIPSGLEILVNIELWSDNQPHPQVGVRDALGGYVLWPGVLWIRLEFLRAIIATIEEEHGGAFREVLVPRHLLKPSIAAAATAGGGNDLSPSSFPTHRKLQTTELVQTCCRTQKVRRDTGWERLVSNQNTHKVPVFLPAA